MTITEYERRLKACNPRLHIKRYGTSKAAIHIGNKFVCRVGQGDIPQYNAFRVEADNHKQYVTPLNPKGAYRWKRLLKRGRAEAAKVMYTSGVIKYNQIAKLS